MHKHPPGTRRRTCPVAAFGLAYSDGKALGGRFGEGMFVGRHGSWNRRPLSGYDVVFVPFRDGRPSGQPMDVLSGFVSAEEEAATPCGG